MGRWWGEVGEGAKTVTPGRRRTHQLTKINRTCAAGTPRVTDDEKKWGEKGGKSAKKKERKKRKKFK